MPCLVPGRIRQKDQKGLNCSYQLTNWLCSLYVQAFHQSKGRVSTNKMIPPTSAVKKRSWKKASSGPWARPKSKRCTYSPHLRKVQQDPVGSVRISKDLRICTALSCCDTNMTQTTLPSGENHYRAAALQNSLPGHDICQLHRVISVVKFQIFLSRSQDSQSVGRSIRHRKTQMWSNDITCQVVHISLRTCHSHDLTLLIATNRDRLSITLNASIACIAYLSVEAIQRKLLRHCWSLPVLCVHSAWRCATTQFAWISVDQRNL